ncbi:MAG TPA: GatB/YqeY domain-containing protein [Chitinophagales bacterium]|nr:GatB/YqeY domain-containing protein [Chitinophagales bacterium]
MSLDQNINNELKEAMLSKNEVKVRTIKAIKAAFLLAKTEKGATGEITAEQEIKILQKLYNQRKESFEIFSKENRPELAIKEKEEMEMIASYLPKQMNDEELTTIVQAVITETGASSIKDMGKVIGAVTKKVAGQAEGARISALVKSLLGA